MAKNIKKILTGITTTGTPHIGNYLGAIKPSLELATENNQRSYFFLADYHAIIKNQNPEEIKKSVKGVALAWLSSGLDTKKSYFYRQSDVTEITELNWILTCLTSKGLMNRAHAYKAAISSNTLEDEKKITMGLFSYPILMAADILIFNSTHVPVGKDQVQHLEMTRDIAIRFNHTFGNVFNLPEAIIPKIETLVPGTDGRKMSKSYNNVIPLLCDEKTLKKTIAKIVTNSLEPGEPKKFENCNVYKLFTYFSEADEIESLKEDYRNGISWGDAKKKLFLQMNDKLNNIRENYERVSKQKDLVNDLLVEGAKKVRPEAAEMLDKVKKLIGICKIK